LWYETPEQYDLQNDVTKPNIVVNNISKIFQQIIVYDKSVL